jgi:gamma-glutamylcyclotransferase (GGCT)/AIG2-like uncharacterized protein YtfP
MLSRYEQVYGELLARKTFTPDLKLLEQNANHIVFIWDSFKLKFPNEKTLQDCVFLGQAWTVENNYVMRVCPTMPMLFQAQPSRAKNLNAARVWGEAYAMKVHDIIKLDAMMDNMGSFKRRTRYIALEDQESATKDKHYSPTVQAWIYLATPEFQAMMEDSLRTGTQVKHDNIPYWEWRHSDMRPTN